MPQPSDLPVTELQDLVYIMHFAISAAGYLWAVLNDNRIRTTNDRMPARGVCFDVDPGGLAREIAVVGEKPYLIGTDRRILEGKPDGWYPVAGSPECLRISADSQVPGLWVVATDTRVFSYNPRSHHWTEHAGGGRAKDICVSKGVPYVIGMDNQVWKSVGAAGWSPLSDGQKASRIAADPESGALWIADLEDRIRYLDGGTWWEHGGGGRARDLAVFKDIPYIRSEGDHLWCGVNGSGWFRMNTVMMGAALS